MNYPVRKVYITQGWGINPDTYAHLGLKGHNGIDLRIFDNNGVKAVSGDLIAPHDGKIIEASNDPNGYGLYYKIENDVEGSILGHNKELLFKVGDNVKEGQLIGYTDNTGWSTGSHVHWGYYRKPRNKANGFSGTCNPSPYINPLQITQDSMQDDLKSILDYYRVKTKDELIKMVDEQLKFLKDERLKNSGLEEQLKLAQDKHRGLIEYIITKIAPLRAFIDQSEESAKGAIVELVSLVDSLNDTIRLNQKEAEKKEQELVKKNEDLQSKLDTLQTQFDKLKQDHARELETMQNRIDKVQEQVEANTKEVTENNKFKQFLKDFITKLLKG